MLKHVAVFAALVLMAAAPVSAQDSWFGSRHVAFNASFNGGLTDYHNSIGMSAGAHASLFRLGPFRFPTIGGDVLLASMCPPYGPDEACKATLNLQLASGIDLVVRTLRDSSERVVEEHSFSVQAARVVAGRLRGDDSWALKLGWSVRW